MSLTLSGGLFLKSDLLNENRLSKKVKKKKRVVVGNAKYHEKKETEYWLYAVYQ